MIRAGEDAGILFFNREKTLALSMDIASLSARTELLLIICPECKRIIIYMGEANFLLPEE